MILFWNIEILMCDLENKTQFFLFWALLKTNINPAKGQLLFKI